MQELKAPINADLGTSREVPKKFQHLNLFEKIGKESLKLIGYFLSLKQTVLMRRVNRSCHGFMNDPNFIRCLIDNGHDADAYSFYQIIRALKKQSNPFSRRLLCLFSNPRPHPNDVKAKMLLQHVFTWNQIAYSKTFSLNFFRYFSSEQSLTWVLERLPEKGIVTLDFRYSTVFKCSHLKLLEHQTLRELNLCDRSFTSLDLQMLTSIRTLTSLGLEACGQMRASDLMTIGTGLPLITRLSLFRCRQVTDDYIQVVITHFSHLSDLNIGKCSKVTTVGLTAIAASSLPLLSLNIIMGPFIGDVEGNFSGFTRLTHLKLTMIREKDLNTIVKHLKHLKYLEVAFCQLDATHNTEKGLTELFQTLPHLRRVRLGRLSYSFCKYGHIFLSKDSP
jgi:hypothetical protein